MKNVFWIINKLRRSYYLSGFQGIYSHFSLDTIYKFIDYRRGSLFLPKSPGILEAYWVSVDAVMKSTLNVYVDFQGENAYTGICGGRWDLYTSGWSEYPLYQAMTARFNKDIQWEETRYYNFCSQKLKNNKEVWNGCTTIEDLDKRCEEVDKLYDNIRNNGYTPWYNRQDRNNKIRVGNSYVPDELFIGIGRHGKLIRLENGRHRLMIAKILGISKIPAVVTLIHDEYGDDIICSNSVLSKINVEF